VNGEKLKAKQFAPPHLKIGYDNRVGRPEGVPRAFVQLIIDCPDRVYGTWWYCPVHDQRPKKQGWYIWIPSRQLLAVTRGPRMTQQRVACWELGLAMAARKLRL
jgi:hypothetical protein